MATATTSAFVKTGNLELDSLTTYGRKWGGAVGTGTTLTYSFHTPGISTYGTQASYGGLAPFDNPTALSEGLKAEVRSALAEWSKVANLKFVEVADNGTASGVLRFGISDDVDKTQVEGKETGAAGYAYTPASNSEKSGDVWLSTKYFSGVNSIQHGTYYYGTLIHEIGHALGLSHPFRSDKDPVDRPELPDSLDHYSYSTMSYTPERSWKEKHLDDGLWYNARGSTPMVLDIQAIQYLYGANKTAASGNDIYKLDPAGLNFLAIWDTAGIDAIDASLFKTSSTINLGAGEFSTISENYAGNVRFSDPSTGGYFTRPLDNISIAKGVVIENAIGGAGDDRITGNAAANRLEGGAGRDTLKGMGGSDFLDGGTGIDTALWGGGRRAYTVTLKSGVDGTVADADGASTVRSVEHLVFVDGEFVTDTGHAAAQILRLYDATLDRAPDTAGLNAWVGGLRGGMNLVQVADGFVASQEFQVKYGTLDNTSFVQQLYVNVLGREGEASGVQAWVGGLQGGLSRAQIVSMVSETAENIERSRPQVEQGLWRREENAAAVARLYDTTLDRLPDLPGLSALKGGLLGGMTLSQIAGEFTASTEFKSKYGTLDDAGFIRQLYRNVLDREGEEAGVQGWLGEFQGGKSREQIVAQFSETAEHQVKLAPYIDDGIWFV